MKMKEIEKHLVCQHLEMLHRRAFEDHQDIIKKLIRRRHGIYALYRKNKLQYVGLAKNLRNRIRHHLNDRHGKTWDRFSVYITLGSDRMRELEALTIRIAYPKGNRQKGKLKNSQNLKKIFRRAALRSFMEGLDEVTEGRSGESIDPASLTDIAKGRKPILSEYIDKGFRIRMLYRGKKYKAYVKKNGMIRFRSKKYTSPSYAGYAITHHGINGWKAWNYERAPGDWVPLDELRK